MDYQLFRKLFFIFLVFEFTTSCSDSGSSKPEKPQAPTPNYYFQTGSVADIRESLQYTCNSGSTSVVEANCHIENLPENIETTLKVPWQCPQTETEGISRLLPGFAEIEIPMAYHKSTSPSITYNLKNVEAFFEPIKNADTDYRKCIKKFKENSSTQLANFFESLLKGSSFCSSFFGKLERPLKYNDQYSAALLKKEYSEEILLPTTFSYYEKIEGVSSKLPISCNEINSFHAYSYDSPDQFVDTTLNMLSKQKINEILSFIKSKATYSACDLVILEYLSIRANVNEACAQKPENKNCQIMIANYKKIINEVSRNLPQGYQEKIEKILEEIPTKNLDEGSYNNIDGQLFSLFYKMTEENSVENPICEDIAVGTKRYVGNNKTVNLNAPYEFSRASESNYQIKINVAFTPECSSSEFENKKISTLWLERANKCLESADNFMKSPENKNIQIRLISEPNLISSPNIINVRKDYHGKERTNSRTYNLGVSCGTVIHEVLHLTGLIDEYEEIYNPSSKDSYQYQCRRLGPEDSVMANHSQAINNSVYYGHSLLKPAHARYLLYPNCAEKNDTYYKCSALAYTSEANCTPQKTQNLPLSCQNGSTDWINK